MGHRFLVSALLGVGGGAASAQDPNLAQPEPAAGLHALFLGRAAGVLRGRALRADRAQPWSPGDNELHALLQAARLLEVGGAGRRGQRRRLPGPWRSRGRDAFCDGRGPHALTRSRTALGADGAVAEPSELARCQCCQGAGTDATLELPGHRARRGRGDVLPVAPVTGRGREVPQRDGASWAGGFLTNLAGDKAAGTGATPIGCRVRKPCRGRGRHRSRLGVMVGAGAPVEAVLASPAGRPAGAVLQARVRSQRGRRFRAPRP